jgi:hypothetical protein
MLRETDKRIINGLISMGMELTENVAHDSSALLVRTIVPQAHFTHGVKYPPVNGLESVPDVGQCPAHDDRHGVIQVGLFYFVLDGYRYYLA